MRSLLFVLVFTITGADEAPTPLPGFNEQDGGVLCGPVSLSTASRMLGTETTVLEVAEAVEFVSNGTNLEELQKVAKANGISAQGYRLESVNQILRLTVDTPTIVQLRGEHFAVVWADSDKDVWLAEFPYELRTVSLRELKKMWDPTVLVLRRPDTQSPFVNSPSNLHLWRFLGIAAAILLIAASTRRLSRTR